MASYQINLRPAQNTSQFNYRWSSLFRHSAFTFTMPGTVEFFLHIAFAIIFYSVSRFIEVHTGETDGPIKRHFIRCSQYAALAVIAAVLCSFKPSVRTNFLAFCVDLLWLHTSYDAIKSELCQSNDCLTIMRSQLVLVAFHAVLSFVAIHLHMR